MIELTTPLDILVKRRAALGDVIMVTGVIRELHNKYNCYIDVATDFGEVFENNPYVRCIHHTSQIPNVDYDLVINLDDAYEKNPTLRFDDTYFYRALGITELSSVNKATELYATEDTCKQVEEFVAKINSKFICVHMRNWHWAMKNIDINVWLAIIDKVMAADPDVKIVCVGGATDFYPENHPRIIDGRELSISALSYLLDSAKCFVGIDSAPFHIAGTSETHIIALLSHLYPAQILPYRNGAVGYNCTVIQSNVPCVGCYARQATPVRSVVCEPGNFPCNKLWDIDRIVTAITHKL